MEASYKKVVRSYEMVPFRATVGVFGCIHCRCFIGYVSDCIHINHESAWIRPLLASHVFPVDDSNFIKCHCDAVIGMNEGGLYHIGSIMRSRLPYDVSRAFGLMPRLIGSPEYNLIICEEPGCSRFYGLYSSFVRTVETNILFPSVLAHNIIMPDDYTRYLRCLCGRRVGNLIRGDCVRLHSYVIVGENDPRLREIIVPQAYDLFQNDDEVDPVRIIDLDSDSDSEFEVIVDSGLESDFD